MDIKHAPTTKKKYHASFFLFAVFYFMLQEIAL
jgi:hypothetical protein